MPELVRIEGVPICATGTYKLSTGEATFTEEDLAAAVRALDDPAVKVPRVKVDGLGDSFDPTAHGGEPAFGYVDAMRVSDDGQTLYGDLMVPAWLAESIEWAYPSRSIEGGQGWQSPTGKTHELVITAVALLGVDLPGVSTLPDLQELLSAEAPKEVLARMPARPGRIAAGLDEDLIRRRYYEWIESGDADLPGGAAAWDLWIRSMRFDERGVAYLKVQNEADGHLYRVDFTVTGDESSYAGHVEIVERDIVVTASTRRPAPALAVWASREQSRAAITTKASASAGPDNEEEAPVMDVDTTLLRRRLGLPENATQDQIREALSAPVEPETTETETTVETAEVDPVEETTAEATAETAETERVADPIAASAARQVADLSTEVAELRDAEQAREKRETTERRDSIVASAVHEGRISPADRDHYRGLLDVDEARATELIQARARGTVPLAPVGDGREPVEASADDAAYRAFMKNHHGIEVA